jgi:hypothetical protein
MAANPPETYGDIGTTKDVLKTLLLGPDFERKLVQVEARFSDGLSVPRLAESQVKTSEMESVPAQFPWCEIVGQQSDPDNEVEYADKNTHRIDIVYWANGDDEETVTKLVERYLLAVRKMIRNETLMPRMGCLPIVRASERYGVVGQKPGLTHPFVKAGAISFAVTTIEA